MCSESFPKEFEKASEVLPFTKYGLSSIQEFKDAEKDIHHLEWLKKAGLTGEEIKLFKENEAGSVDQRKKIESNVMKEKLDIIYSKINKLENEGVSSDDGEQPGTSRQSADIDNNQEESLPFYPEGHPMNNIKKIEENLFGHLKSEEMIPITKRRKILRRLERKKQRILAQGNQINIGTVPNTSKVDRAGSLWDMKEMPRKLPIKKPQDKPMVGPKKRSMYTIKDNKIVRLEAVKQHRNREQRNEGRNEEREDVYRAVDIVVPENEAEAQLLEGTKMALDDIKKIERFKNYEPGIPAKVLYLKNIAPTVTHEQLSLLFNQFMLANGGPIDVRLMTGRMRGQAFVSFQTEDIAIQALEETNGTILSGRPVIAQFRNNRIQDDR